jgi:hypothetical protein
VLLCVVAALPHFPSDPRASGSLALCPSWLCRWLVWLTVANVVVTLVVFITVLLCIAGDGTKDMTSLALPTSAVAAGVPSQSSLGPASSSSSSAVSRPSALGQSSSGRRDSTRSLRASSVEEGLVEPRVLDGSAVPDADAARTRSGAGHSETSRGHGGGDASRSDDAAAATVSAAVVDQTVADVKAFMSTFRARPSDVRRPVCCIAPRWMYYVRGVCGGLS